MITLLTNIQILAGVHHPEQPLRGAALAQLPVIENAYLLIENGVIADFGLMSEWHNRTDGAEPSDRLDCTGCAVLPCWADSHTHIVFAGSREQEFVMKLKGMSYADIAAAGGGILNSARLLNQTSEEELFRVAWLRLQELAKLGTGAIEIKSGYGLTVEGELKMLRVIKRLKEKSNLLIKATFLGAHTYPEPFKENHTGYINQIVSEMLPVIGREQLADYIDVFCETGFFSPQEMETICRAGMQYGLKPKLHVNQLNSIGGIETAIRLNAVSADHLETMTEDDMNQLAASGTIGTLLPTAAYFLRLPFQPARALVDAGAAVALASDYNPGSSPGGNMNTVVSMSCIQMKMLPEEAINAATINGAFAMEVAAQCGSIAVGKRANLIITKPIPSLAYLPYSFSTNLIDTVLINGSPV